MHKLSEIAINDDIRSVVLGRYYPITCDEVHILIRKGLDKNLINFVNDNGYSYLYPIMS